MTAIAHTPTPPYYAVLFTSLQTETLTGYETAAREMLDLARQQPGFLGFETARDTLGISISYWKDEASILGWKQHAEHLLIQQRGIKEWYAAYRIRVCRVEREYGMEKEKG